MVTTGLTVIFSALAAYAIAKLPFKGSNLVFLYFMLGLMVPGEATIVPLFITVNGMHMIDSYAGMILPSIFCVSIPDGRNFWFRFLRYFWLQSFVFRFTGD